MNYGIVFYKNLDDEGTIVEEHDNLDDTYDAFQRLAKVYPNKSIHEGGVLEIESWR
jgi:hypothetical protein